MTIRKTNLICLFSNFLFLFINLLYYSEIYFHLSSPPVIRRIKLWDDPTKPLTNGNLLTKQGDRYTAWDLRERDLGAEINESPIFRIMLFDINNEEYCQIINRLAMTTERHIEFRTFTKEVFFPFNKYKQSPLENEQCKLMCENNFKLMYVFLI
jgi:hypothetical protein